MTALVDLSSESYNFRDCFTIGFPYDSDDILDPKAYSRMRVNGFPIKSTFSLFLAICFSHNRGLQESILADSNLKYLHNYEHENDIRTDYDDIKVDLMYWCLKIKMLCQYRKFGIALEKSRHSLAGRLISETRPLVYVDTKDSFFGMRVELYAPRNYYYERDFQRALDLYPMKGNNIIGKLLAKLRDEPEFSSVDPLNIPDFTLYDTEISTQIRKNKDKNRIGEPDS